MKSWEIILILIAIIFILLYILKNLYTKYNELKHSKKSQSVKYGKMSENFMPFLESYPYEHNNFRFLGNPIDGVQFNDDSIVFVEFKIGNSRLSSTQTKIKNLVESGKVKFEEFRIK